MFSLRWLSGSTKKDPILVTHREMHGRQIHLWVRRKAPLPILNGVDRKNYRWDG